MLEIIPTWKSAFRDAHVGVLIMYGASNLARHPRSFWREEILRNEGPGTEEPKGDGFCLPGKEIYRYEQTAECPLLPISDRKPGFLHSGNEPKG
jgi:hypothetical protein